MDAGAIVPHAPLLAPQIAPRGAPRMKPEEVASRLGAEWDAIVLVSPHGARSGVYRAVEGSLIGFGPWGIEASAPTAPALRDALSELWKRPLLDGPADHGVVVPLLRGSVPFVPVIACALVETTGPRGADPGEAIDDATALADALASMDGGRMALVASAHSSAALSPRAPLGERPEARRVEDALLEALRRDVAKVEVLATELIEDGGSCGAGPLVVLARCLAGRAATVISYEHPYGVGYMEAIIGEHAR